ncbi:hypothetical protein Tco_1053713 [Tanacetum coccineum]|uniref:Uncharacterized protein n=1 Tax=Tanacetum coccineum TaxID=301880 RepID=A0ABQ5GUP2_9ASTR
MESFQETVGGLKDAMEDINESIRGILLQKYYSMKNSQGSRVVKVQVLGVNNRNNGNTIPNNQNHYGRMTKIDILKFHGKDAGLSEAYAVSLFIRGLKKETKVVVDEEFEVLEKNFPSDDGDQLGSLEQIEETVPKTEMIAQISLNALIGLALSQDSGKVITWSTRDCEAEVFQVNNDDTVVAQRWLEDKQPEVKTNMDCLVKEREKVHLGIKVGANITVTGVPGQKGAEGGPRFEVSALDEDVEYRLCLSVSPKHLEEEHVTWAQFGKKWDKNETLQEFDQAMDLQCVETVSGFPLTPSKFQGDDVTTFGDEVKVADLKKPIKDLVGWRR